MVPIKKNRGHSTGYRGKDESAVVGMPQLLVYMASVHEARKSHINRSVFGMLSGSMEFQFSFLDENKKFFMTQPFTWLTE